MYKFKSRATSDLIMLEPHGRQLLVLIGKHAHLDAPASPGVLLPEEIPHALHCLEAAMVQEQAGVSASGTEEDAPQDEAQAPRITLQQRAKPFMDMLRRAQQANREIVWGV